ncbi:Capsular glucan synthase [Planctomycetes bacterium Pla163]|uniref:Capsular glucan synthase n=1 Tax=Rohdeia mirabilis TaxID=2528008 RepID=A0A518D1L3_9BACT|nr:Capsular glucan synthase [Planctomycetes bacterium Pla163]
MPLPLQTLHVFPGFAVGGAQMRAVRLIEALGDGYRHAVVSLSGADAGLELLADPRAVEWIAPPVRAGSLATTRALASLVRARRPDLVLTYNWGALDGVFACRLVGRRALVHHEDGFGPDEVDRRHGRRNLVRRFVLRGAHRVVVPSQVLQTIAAREWRLPARLVELIPNGVDTQRFAPPNDADGTGATERAAVRTELGIDPAAFVLVTVGGLRPEKRPDRVLETLALLPPDVHAILVGTGGELEALERRATEPDLRGRVHLVGARPDPAPMLRAADAFCLPSDTEQMPIAMVEAMAVGLPVVATDVGDVRAILPDQQQDRVVPSGSEAAAGLARGLRALAADPATRAALGRANRARVEEHFTQAGMVARYDALYRAAAARDGR